MAIVSELQASQEQQKPSPPTPEHSGSSSSVRSYDDVLKPILDRENPLGFLEIAIDYLRQKSVLFKDRAVEEKLQHPDPPRPHTPLFQARPLSQRTQNPALEESPTIPSESPTIPPNLTQVHSKSYLKSLKCSSKVALIIENWASSNRTSGPLSGGQ